MIRVGISGICGKMGRRILSLSNKDKDIEIVVGLEKSGHKDVGSVIEGVEVTDKLVGLERCDCLIEFSTPSATLEHLKYLVTLKKPAVVGTTGFSGDGISQISKMAEKIPIVFSPNMSIGVNLIFRLVQEAAKVLKGYKVYIEEAHHIHKKDAPSGTAKKIADILNQEGFGIRYEDIVSIREDEIVGDHSIIFKSDVDEVELSHSAKTRDIFAQGALRAAKWVVGRSAGLYSMNEVLFGEQ